MCIPTCFRLIKEIKEIKNVNTVNMTVFHCFFSKSNSQSQWIFDFVHVGHGLPAPPPQPSHTNFLFSLGMSTIRNEMLTVKKMGRILILDHFYGSTPKSIFTISRHLE